ncbi:LPXTG cell wall anchor domain-containing protein [Alkalibacterium sp.]
MGLIGLVGTLSGAGLHFLRKKK